MKKSYKIIILLIALIICLPLSVHAKGSINIGAKNLEIEKGKTATFTVSATNAVGKVTATSSDIDIVTIVPFSDGSTSGWVENYKSTNDTVTFTINAKSEGTTTIKVVTEAASYDREILDATYTINVTVKDTTVEEEKQITSGLSKLIINEKEINLKDEIYEYDLVLDNDITSVKIDATLYDTINDSFVDEYGSRTIDNLKEGKNEILIKIQTKENKILSYKIIIEREKSNNKSSNAIIVGSIICTVIVATGIGLVFYKRNKNNLK